MKTSIGFFDLLAIIFIIFKLTNVITWSWWWVLSPIWIPFFIVALIIFVMYITIK
jgi:hypothetical protein